MSESPSNEEGLLQTLQALVRELPLMLSDRVELLTLELQRAGMALARIVALVVAAAVVGVTAWMLLWAGIVVGMVQLGLPWYVALLLALVVNAAMALAAISYARRLGALLTLPATRRHLTVSPSIAAPPEAPVAPVAATPPGPPTPPQPPTPQRTAAPPQTATAAAQPRPAGADTPAATSTASPAASSAAPPSATSAAAART